MKGFDDWLDNHGNPGGNMDDNSSIWEWAITEPIFVTQTDLNNYRIDRINGPEWFKLSFEEGGRLLFNGKFVDVGDDFIGYISILDEYHGQLGVIGQTIRQEPFKER